MKEKEEKKLKSPKIRLSGTKEVSVLIPDKEANEQTDVSDIGEERESIRIQAKLAEIGEKLGLKIWLPRNDRSKVQEFWKPKENVLLANCRSHLTTLR